jgi:ApbE superfamily uncharacterized protein (UPF0280 family)
LFFFLSVGSAEDAGSSLAFGEADASTVADGSACLPFAAGLALIAGRVNAMGSADLAGLPSGKFHKFQK